MNGTDKSLVKVDHATPVPPPRGIKKKHRKSLSLDQTKSHSEPSSPMLPRACKPTPPPRPKAARTSSSEQDDCTSPRLQAHVKLEKRPSAPVRPPPPKIALQAVSSKKSSASSPKGSARIPTTIPPRPRSSLAMASTEQGNARTNLVASNNTQHFYTNPRRPRSKKKIVERKTLQPDVTSTSTNTSRSETAIYRNVAPRLPPNARQRSNVAEPPRSESPSSKIIYSKSTESKKQPSSPIQKNSNTYQLSTRLGLQTVKNIKVRPQRPPPPPPRAKAALPYAVYTEIHENQTECCDAEYSYVRMRPRVQPTSSRGLEVLDLEFPRGQDKDLYGKCVKICMVRKCVTVVMCLLRPRLHVTVFQ